MTKMIPLTKGKYAVVDDQDYERISQHEWYCHIGKNGHLSAARRTHGTRKFVYMHREILGALQDEIIDHKDGDGLNNTRDNLRMCTHSQNNMNKRIAKNNTSGMRGVSWHKRHKKWQARIRINGKEKYLGLFDTAEEARGTYLQWETKLFGDFSYTASRS